MCGILKDEVVGWKASKSKIRTYERSYFWGYRYVSNKSLNRNEDVENKEDKAFARLSRCQRWAKWF